MNKKQKPNIELTVPDLKMMKKITFLSLIVLVITISAFAQGGPNGLLMPKFIKATDNSTSTVLTNLSKERHFFRELPADSELSLLKDIVFHESKSIDGDPMSLKMDVITYTDNKTRPCVVYVIGGGFSFAAKERNLYDRHKIAKAGYVVASVQYHVINTGIYSDAVKDVKAAIRCLRANAKEYGIAPENIAVWGESAGGYLAAMVGTTNGVNNFEEGENLNQSSDVKAVVDAYGLSDLTKIGADYDEDAANAHFTVISPDGQFIPGKNSGLTSLDKPEVVAKANPITYIDKSDPPFLLFHGTQDMAVSPSQTLLLHDALREKGVLSTRYVLEGAGHASGEFSDPQVINIIIDFLDKHLKNQ
ncbi:alpha/beta hydrolase [Maribellus maritimus]|uniref:alpha/beta hydrolase n=1 Tax=Maribellus maritimus TaxID=2870838 RepID=UPI001EECCD9E|nr:alpha/beta hydrolase [Maribellus maritimus]MCG6190992.1 alpha/beta hydrolase [Maribellus maritimus]